MHSSDTHANWFSLVANAADICLKPWRHAVVASGPMNVNDSEFDFEKALINGRGPIEWVNR